MTSSGTCNHACADDCGKCRHLRPTSRFWASPKLISSIVKIKKALFRIILKWHNVDNTFGENPSGHSRIITCVHM